MQIYYHIGLVDYVSIYQSVFFIYSHIFTTFFVAVFELFYHIFAVAMPFLGTTNYLMQSTWKFFRRKESGIDFSLTESDGEMVESPLLPFPPVKLYIYNNDFYKELSIDNFEDLWQALATYRPLYKIWMDIEGRGNHEFIHAMGKHFHMHELEMEDISSLHQRPKAEDYGEHLFVVSRMIYHSKATNVLINEQVCFFIYDEFLLTMQEEHEDAFDGVRERLRKSHSGLCNGNIFFLAWSLMDSIVDQYFPILERIGNDLEKIENVLLTNPQKQHLLQIQSVKREIMFLRKAILAERDKLAELERHDFKLIDDKTRVYLRDTYDHTAQIMDIIESQKEISYSLMEVYLSAQNNKMSEVMKVLTVVSSIFIPLTFIVGVYGMNFSTTDKNGKLLPWNMPELYHPYGYIGVMVLMFIIAFLQLIYFKRKRWL